MFLDVKYSSNINIEFDITAIIKAIS